MKILAFDTALGACSVAVLDGVAVLANEQILQAQGQAELLLPQIERAMRRAGLAYRDLDLIAVTVGPGTFTGLRIGLAAARGLGLAAGLPVVGITTLEALAAGVPDAMRHGRSLLAVIDARRGEVYAQAFAADLAPLGPPRLLSHAAAAVLPGAAPVALIGSGGALIAPLLAGRDIVRDAGPPNPDPAALAALAARRGRPPAGAPPPEPLYLRAPDAKLPGGRDPGAQ